MTRILMVTNYYPPYHLGGYEELCEDVFLALTKKGYEASVLTTNYGAKNGLVKEKVSRILHQDMDIRPVRASLGYLIGRQKRIEENKINLKRKIEVFSPDIAICWGMWNINSQVILEIERLMGSNIIYYIADYWPTLPDVYTQHWLEPSRRKLLGIPHNLIRLVAKRKFFIECSYQLLSFKNVICVSKYVKDYLIDSNIPVSNAKIIHNGIDLVEFPFGATRDWKDSSKSGLSLVYAGRLTEEKGVRSTIQALGVLIRKGYRTNLTIIGGGTEYYKKSLLKQVNEARLEKYVTFLGRLPRQSIAELMKQFDVLLVPSVWADPLPRIIQEGMASGLIVIGSETGGIPEIIKDGKNGLLFRPGDANDLADKIILLFKKKELLEKLSLAGRKTIEERFNLDRMIEEFQMYLKSFITHKLTK